LILTRKEGRKEGREVGERYRGFAVKRGGGVNLVWGVGAGKTGVMTASAHKRTLI
jgi:hypothetical protein